MAKRNGKPVQDEKWGAPAADAPIGPVTNDVGETVAGPMVDEAAATDAPPAKVQAEPPAPTRDVRLSVTVVPGETVGYASRHVEVQLDHLQSLTMRRILDGLQRKAARLANGRFVQSNADAIRWILEQVAR